MCVGSCLSFRILISPVFSQSSIFTAAFFNGFVLSLINTHGQRADQLLNKSKQIEVGKPRFRYSGYTSMPTQLGIDDETT